MGKKKGKGQGPAPRSSNNSISEPGQPANQEATTTQVQQPPAAVPSQSAAANLTTPAVTAISASPTLPTAAAPSSVLPPTAAATPPVATVSPPTAALPAGPKVTVPAGSPGVAKAPFISSALPNMPQAVPTGPLPAAAPIPIAAVKNPLTPTQSTPPISCAVGSPTTNFPMQFGSSPKGALPLQQKQSTPQPIAPPSSKMSPSLCPGISQSPVKLSDIGINQTLSSSPKDSKPVNVLQKLPDISPPQVPKLPDFSAGNLTKQEVKELAPKSTKTQPKGSPKVERKEQQAEVMRNIIDTSSKTLPSTQSKLNDPLKPVPLLTDFSQILSSTNPLTSFTNTSIEKKEDTPSLPLDKNLPIEKPKGVPIENKSKKPMELKGSPITQPPISLESLLENITGKEAAKDILGSPSTEIKTPKAEVKESASLPVGSPKLQQKQAAKQQGNKNAAEKVFQPQQINVAAAPTNISTEKIQDIKLAASQNIPASNAAISDIKISAPVLEQQKNESEKVKEVKPIQKPEIPKKPTGLVPTKQQSKPDIANKAAVEETGKDKVVKDVPVTQKVNESSNPKQDSQEKKGADIKLEGKVSQPNLKGENLSEIRLTPQDISGSVDNQQSVKTKPSTPAKEQTPSQVTSPEKTQNLGKKETIVDKKKNEQPKKEESSAKGKDVNEKKGKNGGKGATAEDFLKDPKVPEKVSPSDRAPEVPKQEKQITKQDKPAQKEITTAAQTQEKIEKVLSKQEENKKQEVEKKPQDSDKKKPSDIPTKQEAPNKSEANKNDKTSVKEEKSDPKKKSKEENINVEKPPTKDQNTPETKTTPTKAVSEKSNNKNDKNKQGQNKDVKQQKDEKDQKKDDLPAEAKDSKQQQKVKEDVKETQPVKQDSKEKQRKVSESEKARKVSESEKAKKPNDNDKARKVSESEKTRKVSESEKTRKVSESDKSKKEQAKQNKAADGKQNVEKSGQLISENVQAKDDKKPQNKQQQQQQQKTPSNQEENKGQGKGPKDKKTNDKAPPKESVDKSAKENIAIIPEATNIPLKEAADNKKPPKAQPAAKSKEDKAKTKEPTKEKVAEKTKPPTQAAEKKESSAIEDKDLDDESGDGSNVEVSAAKKKRRRKKKNKKPADGTQAEGQQAGQNKQPEKQEAKAPKKPKENQQPSNKQPENTQGTKPEKTQAVKVEVSPAQVPVTQPKVVADVNKDKKPSESQETDTSQAKKKKNKKKNKKGAGGDDEPQETENDPAGQKKNSV